MNNLNRKHYPAEIFGYPVENNSREAKYFRDGYLCPFSTECKCGKLSRLITYPMGVCSTWWPNNGPIAICPKRFLQDKIIFVNAAKYVFGNTDNVILFPEVRLKGIGCFDFVLVKHKPISNEIEDFCVVEIQTDSTTSTGKLVTALEEFMQGKNITKSHYAYGMNTYNTIKLSFIQMLNKGQVFEHWNKKIIWVVQTYVYENMTNRFKLKDMNFNENDANIFHIYDIDHCSNSNKYQLKLENISSSTIENLMKAFQSVNLPKVSDFIKVLHKKIQLNLGIKM
jgi:hypothetical protein